MCLQFAYDKALTASDELVYIFTDDNRFMELKSFVVEDLEIEYEYAKINQDHKIKDVEGIT